MRHVNHAPTIYVRGYTWRSPCSTFRCDPKNCSRNSTLLKKKTDTITQPKKGMTIAPWNNTNTNSQTQSLMQKSIMHDLFEFKNMFTPGVSRRRMRVGNQRCTTSFLKWVSYIQRFFCENHPAAQLWSVNSLLSYVLLSFVQRPIQHRQVTGHQKHRIQS